MPILLCMLEYVRLEWINYLQVFVEALNSEQLCLYEPSNLFCLSLELLYACYNCFFHHIITQSLYLNQTIRDTYNQFLNKLYAMYSCLLHTLHSHIAAFTSVISHLMLLLSFFIQINSEPLSLHDKLFHIQHTCR